MTYDIYVSQASCTPFSLTSIPDRWISLLSSENFSREESVKILKSLLQASVTPSGGYHIQVIHSGPSQIELHNSIAMEELFKLLSKENKQFSLTFRNVNISGPILEVLSNRIDLLQRNMQKMLLESCFIEDEAQSIASFETLKQLQENTR